MVARENGYHHAIPRIRLPIIGPESIKNLDKIFLELFGTKGPPLTWKKFFVKFFDENTPINVNCYAEHHSMLHFALRARVSIRGK